MLYELVYVELDKNRFLLFYLINLHEIYFYLLSFFIINLFV